MGNENNYWNYRLLNTMESWLPQINEDPTKERQKHLTVFKKEQRNRDLSSVKLKLRCRSKHIEKLWYIKFQNNEKWVDLLDGLDKYSPKPPVDLKPKRGLGYRSKPPPINNEKTMSVYK